jgi:hypothetical protein
MKEDGGGEREGHRQNSMPGGNMERMYTKIKNWKGSNKVE